MAIVGAGGAYRFGPLDSQHPENNFGVPVFGGGSGPGTATYRLRVGQFQTTADCETATVASTSSNQMVSADLTINDPFEPPDIRSCPSVGQPVSVASGNVFFDHTDATLPGGSGRLAFVRAYNSANTAPGTYGVFGPGWSHSYERRLTLHSANVLALRGPDGVVSYYQDFSPSTDGIFEPSVPFTSESRIVRQPNSSYVREFRAGGSEHYAALGGPDNGRLTALIDAAGNAINLTYDSATGRLTAITDQLSLRQLTLAYPNGNTMTLSGPMGLLLATYTFTNGELGSVIYADSDDDGADPDGGYSFEYYDTTPPRLWKVKDGDENVIETHEYDSLGRATTSEVANGIEKFTLVYEPLKTTVTDANGNQTTYEYSNVWGMRRPFRTTGPCPACGSGTGTQTWTYDTRGRVLTHRDAEGYETRYTYDQASGDLLSETRVVDLSTGATHQTSYTYWPLESPGKGRIHTRTAPNGAVTAYEYDPPGPKTIIEQTDTSRWRTTHITYTSQGEPGAGKVKFVDDPRNKRWEYHYFASGDLEWVKDPLGHQTRYTYDPMGRQKQVIRPTLVPVPNTPNDPPIQEPETTYDTLGRVSRIRNPDDETTTRFTYDGAGRRRTMTDALGRVTESIYDQYGRLWKVKDAQLHETEYGYDPASNLTSIKDARGKTTTFVPDATNRVERVCYPADDGEPPCQRYEQFTYDGVGRLKTRRDRRGVVTTFIYDGLGRLKSKTYSDGTPTTTYGYDEGGTSQKGRQTSAVAGPISLGWSYDLAGEAVTALRTKGTATHTLAYTYDDAGARLTLTLDGQLLTTQYWDDRGLLDHIVRAPDATFQFAYDTASRRKSVAFPNNVLTAYGYDQRSRVTSLAAGGGSITNFTYPSYDAMNMRLARGGTTAPAEAYGYDSLYRLTTVQRGQPPQPSEGYSYDVVGNRSPAQPPIWTYSNRNELLSRPNASYLYDLNGNLVQKTEAPYVWTYEWDAENRLKVVRRDGVQVASYVYDALGRRAERHWGINHREYVYDAEDILLSKFSADGMVGNDFEMINHLFVHGPGIDEPLSVQGDIGETSWYYHADALGSIVRMTDENGEEVRETGSAHQYGAFGTHDVEGYSGYGFTGREWDPETGLYYYRARYYDPSIGRFISEDPLGFDADVNNYVYAKNQPDILIDPTGLMTVTDNIIKIRTMNLSASCVPTARGAQAHGACTFAAAALVCNCTCDVDCWKLSAELRIYGRMYIFNGPFRTLSTRPHDTSVVDAASAIAHEYRVHINQAIAAVRGIVEIAEAQTYPSGADCWMMCKVLQATVPGIFRQVLAATQRAEEAGN